MSLCLHKSGKLSKKTGGVATTTENAEDEIVSKQDYELYAICWAILDPSTGKAVNIVATVNVGPTYHARVASPVRTHYFFASLFFPSKCGSFISR